MHEGLPYNRAGVLLTGLAPRGSRPALWDDTTPERNNLNAAIDTVWTRHGRHVLGHGTTGLREPRRWEMRQDLLSPAKTTNWEELLVVH